MTDVHRSDYPQEASLISVTNYRSTSRWVNALIGSERVPDPERQWLEYDVKVDPDFRCVPCPGHHLTWFLLHMKGV